MEVAGYLVVAIQDAHHYVAGDQAIQVEIVMPDGGSELWRVPEALFTRDQDGG
jgi:hypothetical protein